MPLPTPLETERLIICPFDPRSVTGKLFMKRKTVLSDDDQWLKWAVDQHERMRSLYKPPYGDNAMLLKATREMVGLCGLMRCLIPSELRPDPEPGEPVGPSGFGDGIFCDLIPSQRSQGYATEASQALIDYAFHVLHLPRLTATTQGNNQASINVIKKLGMRIKLNTDDDFPGFPAYMEVVGEIFNPEVWEPGERS
jgi:RimJ/RimL family protein N-acetyltransferase